MVSAANIYLRSNTSIESSSWLHDGSGFGGNVFGDFFTGGSGVGAGRDSVHDGSSLLYLPKPFEDLVTDPLVLEALQCG